MRALVVALALGGCANEGVANCTLIGCADNMRVGLTPFTDPAPYLGATVEMCVNERCAHVVVTDTLPPTGFGYESSSGGDPRVSATLGSNTDGTYGLSIDLVADDETLERGDAYTLEIRDTNNAPILERSWTAEYAESFPNGAECAPRCLTQSIVL